MEVIKQHIQVPLAFFNETDFLEIYPENKARLFEITEEEANENGESIFQILEGNSYEYAFTDKKYRLHCSIDGIVSQSKRELSQGRIVPNIYVGTLTLFVTDTTQDGKECEITIEVLATKFDTELDKSYRENYRFMLKDITDKCTELLMQINSPVEQNFETDFSRDNQTIYQRFSFINAIVQNKDFEEAVLKIIASPKTNWDTEEEIVDIRRIKRFTNTAIKQITSGSNRIPLNLSHSLYNSGIHSIPNKINGFRKIEHTDTSENRFVKHALEVFLNFAEDCQKYFKENRLNRPNIEASNLVAKLDGFLSQSFFKNISRPISLKLNSPVLQRKSGYREILSTWLQYDLASKLVWKGGDDVYKAGKRDIATLYEYWLFFTLYDLVKEKFNIQSVKFDEKAYKHLIVPTNDGLNVMIKSGKHTALEGIYTKRNRDLKVKFSYNRTFKGGVEYTAAKSGSWTAPLRPDYTISIWSNSFSEEQAEANESIVHIHFDAKYKITNFYQTVHPNLEGIGLEQALNQEDLDERKGTYKNVDLLKMHAYKDAIRRSGGAYILYPGAKEKPFRGFHEIIPGLGAFSVNPSTNKSEINELSKFIDSIINHLLDRTSQREQLSDETFKIFKEPKSDNNVLHENIPEYFNSEKLNPNETFVLVGFYKSKEQLDWILKNKLYNLRTGIDKGSLALSIENINAKYLILHGTNELVTDKIFQLKTTGPKIFTQNNLIKKGYPDPKGELYLVFEIEKNAAMDFNNISIDIRKIPKFENHRNSSKPISASLTEILRAKTFDK